MAAIAAIMVATNNQPTNMNNKCKTSYINHKYAWETVIIVKHNKASE
jgi:hypothetical protein